MSSNACICVYMCRHVSVCPWSFGLDDDRQCKVDRWQMQTDFYWISSFPRSWLELPLSLQVRSACWKWRMSQKQQNRGDRELGSIPEGPSVSLKCSSPSFRWSVPDFIFPHSKLDPSSDTFLISFSSLLFLSSTNPQLLFSLQLFTSYPTLYFFCPVLVSFFSFAITVICNIRRTEI